MPITRSIIESIKDHGYGPELIPSAESVSPAINNEAIIQEINSMPPNMLSQIHNIYADRNDDADLRIKANTHETECRCAAIPDWILPTEFDMVCHSTSRIRVFARAALTDYPVCHGLYVWRATVADKLALGITLTPQEAEINEKYGVQGTLDRGTLPILMDRYFLYEYWPIYRETKCVRDTIPTTGYAIDTIRPVVTGETFVALTAVNSTNVASASNCRFTIQRDGDGDAANPFVTLNCDAMTAELTLPCFIPAMSELRLRMETTVQVANHEFYYTYTHYRLNNILRMRFGLTPREDNPELYDKVIAGVV